MSNDPYIRLRERQARRLSLLFRLMRIFPIRKNKIVFSTYEGDSGFCCNPRYIAEELHERRPDLEYVWLTKDLTRTFPDYISVKAYTPWSLAYQLSTARIWIDNYRKPLGTLKRKGQLYIQTWHASIGFKAVGLYRGDAFPEIARIVSEWDSNLADYFLSNSEYCDRVYPKKLLYNGPTLRTGSPRVDCLVNDRENLSSYLRERLGLSPQMKLLLFAPTFRGGNQNGKKQVVAEVPQLDFDRLIRVLQKRFGGEWRILLRLHPQLSAKMDEMPLLTKDERLVDVSKDPDISEIMAGCDVVITDYSSCAFDAAFAKIPVFLFADDVQEYIGNRGQFMWKWEELPFSLAETNDELEACIMHFQEDQYNNDIDRFMNKHDVLEDGRSSERVADAILRWEQDGKCLAIS